MKKLWTVVLTVFTFLLTGTAFAQMQHHGGGMQNLWPDSLTTIELTGTVMIDSSFVHPMYFLDEDGDGTADYHLSFGPWWYEPESGVTRPADGETVTVVGQVQGAMLPQSVLVFEINGVTWREQVGYGTHGWNGDFFWNDSGDTLTVTGVVMIDTTYFYQQYFMDTDSDSIPEYRLGFGPPWYEPENGATRPANGETVTVFGQVHDMFGVDMLAVFTINGMEWRAPDQPAPWAGTWMFRNHSDSAFAYCVNDSANWVRFPPGHMGMGMGMMWPDSSFVQFWEIHPDSLPGNHDAEQFRGFYLNIHDPRGMGMMDGRFGGRHGMMRFQKEHEFRFHYDDDDLVHLGLSEDGIAMKYWDDETQQWQNVPGISVDTQANTVTVSTADLSNYYTLTATSSVTGVEDAASTAIPSEFVLQQNYPNPFNPSTTIRFQLPEQSRVQLIVYNLLGQRVAELLNADRAAGSYTVQWNGEDSAGRLVSSGIYLIRLEAGNRTMIRRMTLLK